MSKAKKFDLESSAPILDDEDEETLAAIDEGIRDADAGRVILAENVRDLLERRYHDLESGSVQPIDGEDRRTPP